MASSPLTLSSNRCGRESESTEENDWPRIHGVNGVFKHLDDQVVGGKLVDEETELSAEHIKAQLRDTSDIVRAFVPAPRTRKELQQKEVVTL